MLPYTGDYTEYIEPGKNSFKFYSFTPRPLMRGDMYQMDDELAALLSEAHRNIGFLDGLVKYAPNKAAFDELMLLKECTYSRMIDYGGLDFKEVLTRRGTNKGDITPIINLEAAYRMSNNMKISTPDLSRICGIALYGDLEESSIGVRDHQTFWLGVKTNFKGYNPTAPNAVLPALADISAYLYNDQHTDSLVKAALVHYQFEMIHPFEQYNGIIGRILVPIILQDIAEEALPLICLSEFLYYNKNEYYDLLRTTQYSGGYIRWIKFFVNAISEVAKQSAQLLIEYESIISKDISQLKSAALQSKSIWSIYDFLKRFPITRISNAAEQLGLSFNSISKAVRVLEENGIVTQKNSNQRNRIWEYSKLQHLLA